MTDRLSVALLRCLPKRLVSRAAGGLARAPIPAAAHRAAIAAFSRTYGIDVGEAEKPPSEYRTFNEFFARRLRPGARPIAPGDDLPVSPVDGTVSQAGIGTAGRLVQAKGRDYSLAALVADEAEAKRFEGGAYLTLYLSPRDYHRIHAPLGGRILGYAYVPGQLWPVNRPSVAGVPDLFAVNERLVTYLETPVGHLALVAVGATVVGRIRAAYDDIFTQAGQPGRRVKYERPIEIGKGDELGVFEMGSTVILLFEPGRIALDDRLAPEVHVRVGEPIGRAVAPAPGGP
jgi:phosphatidylserine decarboxylase